MSVRCIECAHVALSDGHRAPMEGCGVCLANRPMGTQCVHVGLQAQRECQHFARALPEVVAERERVEAERELQRVVRRHVIAMGELVGRQPRAQYLADVEAKDGAQVRQQLETAFLAAWRERKAAEA